MDMFIRAMTPGAERLKLLDQAGPGHYICSKCLAVHKIDELRLGRGRGQGEHPDMRYCPCGANVDWSGFLTWHQLQASKRIPVTA
jgi:hypothetical protein